ncbi:uncharacterized protein EV420DRAFT_1265421 [Desarmillaria tabescens]|uniref:Integrase zinc-binding domain-containing protein n=1 Tax=Armillaria tabescens TaxID=1929756 RepID=A0AA39NB55_ARMTA|nr:uncharacterized protein EV420DRAFT_1265421 [Desarmillaria tabescens]KAK0462392.1 hypothetical protein EV420DRAFT_1265421 [Desarmillaria tabescens]
MSTSELLALRIRQLSRHTTDLERTAETLKIARCQNREQFIQRFEHRLLKKDYQPGSLVLVQNSHLEMTVNRFKTHPRYLGPYEVECKTLGGSYKLKELDGTSLQKNVAAFRLYPYIRRGSPEFEALKEPEEQTWDPSEYVNEEIEEDEEGPDQEWSD